MNALQNDSVTQIWIPASQHQFPPLQSEDVYTVYKLRMSDVVLVSRSFKNYQIGRSSSWIGELCKLSNV